MERRRNERKALTGPVQLESGLPESGWPAPGRIEVAGIDLSLGGLGIQTNILLEESAVVRALIPVSGCQVSVPALAQVVWVSSGRQPFRVGLRFLV